MKRVVILLVGAAVFFCVMMVFGPWQLSEVRQESDTVSRVSGGVLGMLLIFGGFFGVVALIDAAIRAGEAPERKEIQQWGEEQRIEKMERELEAYRIWAKSGKMPVKISPQGDTRRKP